MVQPKAASTQRGSARGGAVAAKFTEREAGDSMLRFLSRLSAFGLAAGREPLLKPAKPGG